jgi:hypothetical protein
MSAEMEIIEEHAYNRRDVPAQTELSTGTVVFAIISSHECITREAVVLLDNGDTVDVCPTLPGRRFCHNVSRMVVRRKNELYPEQIQAKTQWKKDSGGSQYVCANCGAVSQTHPRDIP